MINGGYLIPANTKKGQLIAGYFTSTDLILLAIGISLSVLLLIIFGTGNLIGGIICLLPGLISAFLVMPVANYRNIRTFFKSMIEWFNSQKEYRWKGWCLYEQTRK